ncbi:MAG: tRNA lysidine(34) synthetase TilS, partial [Oscillospiraceae bacterium]|nr:tRNA lysidine(34) synthetase TilS [Oscillospiraceae bacterium]
MIDKIINTIEIYSMIKKGDRITAALSGGADSVCLLLVLKELSESYNITVDAIHINHCIRGEESDRDEEFCRSLCTKLHIPITVIRTDVPSAAAGSKKSLEETARDIRYETFKKHAGKNGKIATAHTLSDNAETVILNLARGTGLKGLCGIPPVRDNIIRPLIEITRQQVEDCLKEQNQGFVTDSTNLSNDYTRNRIRHNIIPELLKINGGFYKTFSAGQKILKEENNFISNYAES